MENSSSISYGAFSKGIGGKWGAFTSSILSSPKDRIKGTPQQVTPPRDLSPSIEDYSEFERDLGKNGVCSSALKENEVSAPQKRRKVKRLELNFSGDEEDSIDPFGYIRNTPQHSFGSIGSFNIDGGGLEDYFLEYIEKENIDPSFEMASLITDSDVDRMKAAMDRSDWGNILPKRRKQTQVPNSLLNKTSTQAQPQPLPQLESVREEQANTFHAPKDIRKKGRKSKKPKASSKDKIGKFPCKCCFRPFSSKHNARLHELTHKTWEELEGETVYHEKCGECNKIFFNKGNYQAHSDMHVGVRRFKCSKCDKAFTRQDTLISHSFVHLTEEEKGKVKSGWKNDCYFCSKKFIAPSQLIIHMVTHTRERPFKCITCRKTFTRNGHLTTHKRGHNKKTRRAFKCETCEKSFTEKGSLSVHHKTVHLAQKNVPCPICRKPFGTRSHMVRHMKAVHLKEAHKCPQCPKTYSRKGNLQTHVKKEHQK